MAGPGWYAAYVFDLDGTLYLGEELLPGARQVVDRLRARDIPVRFVSNNPTLTLDQYRAKLDRLGLGVRPGELITSLVTTTRWLQRNRPDAVVFPIGEQPLTDALVAAGQRLSDDPSEIDIVLASYDRGFTYRKLQLAFAALWFHRRAVLMSTNPDRFCPMPGGRGEPDAASLVAAIETATGATCERSFGKPSPVMLEVVTESLGVAASDTLAVGDRLATDIAMARAAGMAAALVLTGDSTRDDVAALPDEQRPTWVLESVADLLPPAD